MPQIETGLLVADIQFDHILSEYPNIGLKFVE